jgi:hypothetical protein
MTTLTIELSKPAKNATIRYEGVLLKHDAGHILIYACWTFETKDLGYIRFDKGDHFFEHYYLNEWFNIFEIRNPRGKLKGWYCNVTRPATFDGTILRSEDLELDLFVSADRQTILVLDEDEFEARQLQRNDPQAHEAALDALFMLKTMAHLGEPPFNGTDVLLSLGF